MCTFAVQTVVCGNITCNISDPINITLYTTESTVNTPTDSLSPTENQATNYSKTIQTNNSAIISQVYIISFSCLATALFMGGVASLVVIAIFLKRSKAKIRAASAQSNRAEETTHKYNEPAYENVTLSPLPSVSVINTHDNVAYGHTTSTRGAMQDVPIYQNDTCPSSRTGINTQDNVAYGCAKTSIKRAGATQDVPMYKEVTDPISTQDNAAYGCTLQL